jgi:plastocyanin
MKAARIALAALSLALLVAGGAAAATVTVEARTGRVFSPANVTIQVGDTVEWVNTDTMGHTATSGPQGNPDGLFDSGNIAPAGRFSFTFTQAGTYPYYCDFHSGMVGRVSVVDGPIVQAATGRQFIPSTLTIQVGDTVNWVNTDTMPHTVTSGPEGSPSGLFDSGSLNPGALFSFTFTQAGTFPYYCDFHSGMTAEVIVQDSCISPFVLFLVKDQSDVVLTWCGGVAPIDALRGGRPTPTMPSLPPWQAGVSSPLTDAGVVSVPPDYYYQIE